MGEATSGNAPRFWPAQINQQLAIKEENAASNALYWSYEQNIDDFTN